MIAKWFLVAVFTLYALLTIGSVGKPRKPTTPDVAAGVVGFCALYIVLIVVFWRT